MLVKRMKSVASFLYNAFALMSVASSNAIAKTNEENMDCFTLTTKSSLSKTYTGSYQDLLKEASKNGGIVTFIKDDFSVDHVDPSEHSVGYSNSHAVRVTRHNPIAGPDSIYGIYDFYNLKKPTKEEVARYTRVLSTKPEDQKTSFNPIEFSKKGDTHICTTGTISFFRHSAQQMKKIFCETLPDILVKECETDNLLTDPPSSFSSSPFRKEL